MKKVIILNGSPRKNGNTAVLAEYLKNQLVGNYGVEHLFLYDYIINPCTDCRECKHDKLTCVIDDEMQELYSKMNESEILVFGTPIYWYTPSGVTKMMIDRLRPYFANKKLKGKKAIVILAAGSGATDCNLSLEMFQRVFDTLEIKYLGAITSESYDAGDAYNDKSALDSIDKIIR